MQALSSKTMIGHTADDLALLASQIKGLSVEDAMRFLGGKGFANKAQVKLLEQLGGIGAGGATGLGGKVARFAGGKTAHNLLRVVPGIGVGITALDAADIVTNDTNLGNKAMDAGAMGVGGVIGGVLGMGNPLAVATGASVGKMGSDAVQYLLGGGKSAEQRKLEEALMLLNGGRI